MPWRYNICGATHEAILKPLSEAKTVSELKVALEKIWDNLTQVQLRKLSRVFEIVDVKGDGRHSGHFSQLKKCSRLRCLCCLV